MVDLHACIMFILLAGQHLVQGDRMFSFAFSLTIQVSNQDAWCTSPVLPLSLLFPWLLLVLSLAWGGNMRGPSVMDVCKDIKGRLPNVLLICGVEGRTYIVRYTEVEAKHRSRAGVWMITHDSTILGLMRGLFRLVACIYTRILIFLLTNTCSRS